MADHYEAPDWMTRKVFNKLVLGLMRLGVSPRGSRMLEVSGRKTGKIRQVPVNLLDFEGQRYLVSPRGHTEWVRNLRAASGQLALVLGRTREQLIATEIADSERAPVLRAYLAKWNLETGRHFEGVGPKSTDDEFAAVAVDHPVFVLAAVSSGG
ncbi:MAG TPA: nitroreductase family deazaflavin-dependent oxidoreductase [Acidimicrobiia bacterium]